MRHDTVATFGGDLVYSRSGQDEARQAASALSFAKRERGRRLQQQAAPTTPSSNSHVDYGGWARDEYRTPVAAIPERTFELQVNGSAIYSMIRGFSYRVSNSTLLAFWWWPSGSGLLVVAFW